jgi:hypothetical protein
MTSWPDVPVREEYICRHCGNPAGQAGYDAVKVTFQITCVVCNTSTLEWLTLAEAHTIWDHGYPEDSVGWH